MQFYGVLVLLVTLSTACGLRCYACIVDNNTPCTTIGTCAPGLDRCATLNLNGVIIKGCENSATCISPIKCCKGDLCNSAIPTASSVFLLLVSSAITTVFF